MTPEELAAEAAAAAEAEAAAAGTEEESAADLWAEFDEMDGGNGTLTIEGTVNTGEPGDDEDTNGADFGESDDDAGNTGADTGAEAPTDATDPAADAAAQTLWDSVPAELRSEYDRLTAENAKLVHKERSAAGRATGYQRRYEELLKAAQPRATAGDRPTSQAAIEALKEDYPEIAAPLEQALGSIQEQVSHLSAAEESRVAAAQTELTEFLNEETEALVAQHADYEQVLGQNSEQFRVWIDDQPRAVRDAFARNAQDIVNAAEAAQVIGAFKAHLGMPAPAPAVPAPRTPAVPSALASKRERQLGATATVNRTNRRPTTSGIPEDGDPQMIWDAFEAAENPRR